MITLGVLSQGKSIAMGHLELAHAESGENVVQCKSRSGDLVCKVTLFIERKGFITQDLFDLDTLKDQCNLLCERYAPHCPVVKTQFGFTVPAAFFTRYFRKASAAEHEYSEQLLRIVKARYGKNSIITPEMYAESLSSYLQMCVDTSHIKDDSSMAVEAVYAHMFVPASQLIGMEYDPTMVHLEDNDGHEHVALALYDNTTHKNYLACLSMVASTLENTTESSAPEGLLEFKCPSKAFKKVMFQYGKNGMRKVDSDVSSWLSGKCKIPFKAFLEMDTMVIDNAIKLYAEIPQNTGRVIGIDTAGGTSGKRFRRYAKEGISTFLSGCRTVIVRLEKDNAVHEWTEYIVFE